MKMKFITLLLAAVMAFSACAQTNSCCNETAADTGKQAAVGQTAAAQEKETIPETGQQSAAKRVSILGDSYSTFEGYIPEGYIAWYKPVPKEGRPTDVTDVDQTWWKIFIDENGYQLEKNNSYSGATVCNTGYGNNDYSDRSFVTRLTDLGNPDLILIFGGTNDDWAGSPLGDYVWENWTPKQLYSYRPATAYMLAKLQEKHHNAEIIVMINDILRPEIVESTKKICDHYGVKYLETENIEKMSDHPDRKGMKAIAEQLELKIKK